jgi:hypothetical protein
MKTKKQLAVGIMVLVAVALVFIATQRLSANGFPRQVETVAGVQVIGQTGALPLTTLYTPTQTAMYRVSAYSTVTVPGSVQGGLGLNLQWTDPVRTQLSLVGGFCADRVGCSVSTTFVVYATANQPIAFDVTEKGIAVSPTYNVYVSVERL